MFYDTIRDTNDISGIRTRFLSVNVEMASEKRGAVRGNRETASEKFEHHVDIDRKKESR